MKGVELILLPWKSSKLDLNMKYQKHEAREIMNNIIQIYQNGT